MKSLGVLRIHYCRFHGKGFLQTQTWKNKIAWFASSCWLCFSSNYLIGQYFESLSYEIDNMHLFPVPRIRFRKNTMNSLSVSWIHYVFSIFFDQSVDPYILTSPWIPIFFYQSVDPYILTRPWIPIFSYQSVDPYIFLSVRGSLYLDSSMDPYIFYQSVDPYILTGPWIPLFFISPWIPIFRPVHGSLYFLSARGSLYFDRSMDPFIFYQSVDPYII